MGDDLNILGLFCLFITVHFSLWICDFFVQLSDGCWSSPIPAIIRNLVVTARLIGAEMAELGEAVEKKVQKMEVDYSATVDKKIPQCEALAAVIWHILRGCCCSP